MSKNEDQSVLIRGVIHFRCGCPFVLIPSSERAGQYLCRCKLTLVSIEVLPEGDTTLLLQEKSWGKEQRSVGGGLGSGPEGGGGWRLGSNDPPLGMDKLAAYVSKPTGVSAETQRNMIVLLADIVNSIID